MKEGCHRSLAPWVVVLALSLLLTSVAWPQASTGTVSGTVRDASGSAIPNATVSLMNTATNITARTTTNPVGFYRFPGVVPGLYHLAVESSGLEKFEGNLTVQVQQSVVVDVELKIATLSTQISVSGDITPLVSADNSTLGHVLERARIEQLPINGRQVTTLLVTVPGMERLRPSGLMVDAAAFVLDGADLSDKGWGLTAPGLTEIRLPGMDGLEEFKVETNSSSARFSRPASIVMSTKSGTNQLHGWAFETNRNNAIGKARQREDYYQKAPQLNRNEFGVSAGGPVFLPKLYDGRNRTFWFFAYEAYRNIAPITAGASVPTEAMRNGDFRGLVDSQGRLSRIYDPWTTNPDTWGRQPFAYRGQANVIDPALMSPLAKSLFAVTPLPTLPQINPLLAPNWFGPWPDTKRQWTATSRVDQNFSANDRFYARYTQGGSTYYTQHWDMPMLAPYDFVNGYTLWWPNKSVALSYVHTFSPTLFNEVLVSATRERWFKSTGDPAVKYADQLGLPNPLNATGWPELTNTGLTGYRFHTDSHDGHPTLYVILDDNATKVLGKHELQFGIHLRYNQQNYLEQGANQGAADFSTGTTALFDPASSRTNPLATPLTGSDIANMYLGIANYNTTFYKPRLYLRSREYAAYLQDNYKVTPRLTLNIGLRWERWPFVREKNNALLGFDEANHAIVLGQDLDTMYRLGQTLPAIVNGLQALGAKFETYKEAGIPQNMARSTWKDFGPRLGFAYRTGAGPRSAVLRGGYTISYFHVFSHQWLGVGNSVPLTGTFSNSLTNAALSPDGIGSYGMRSIPAVIAGKNSTNALNLAKAVLTRGSSSTTYFDQNQPEQRVQQWNLTLEKEILPDTVARAAYVGNHADNQPQTYAFNSVMPTYIWYATTGQALPTGEFSNVALRPYDQVVYGNISRYGLWGWANYNGVQLELERRYSKGYGFQLFYVIGNMLSTTEQDNTLDLLSTSIGPSVTSIAALNQFLPGAVPTDFDARNRFLNYRRDATVPKHRVSWNWTVDLPFGKGKLLGRNAGGVLDRLIGGWQVAGIGTLRSTYFSLPTNNYPNGNKLEVYGYKYPIQDCTSGTCYPGYLWFNGYIPANKINSVDPTTGKPNGIMGVPSDYKPALQPLIPWGSTALPPNAPANTNVSSFWDTNTVWIPLKDGTVQRTTYNDNLHPWRNQYIPSTRQFDVDASLFKRVAITERMYLRFNADFFNVFNNPGNRVNMDPTGVLSTRFSGQTARQVQLTLRLAW